jgi:membrane protein
MDLGATRERLVAQSVLVAGVWLATSGLLLFGRVPWPRLAVGAVLTGVIPAISTWMIGVGAVLVGSALVGLIVSEDPTVVSVVRSTEAAARASWARVRVPGGRAARRSAAGPPPPPPG